MNRRGEYAGDAASKAGNGIMVTGASGRVEFSDRQRSHPRISRRHLERRDGLVEGRPGVAAVSILRQRGIDEVEDVNIDVQGERTRREMVKCRPGGTGTSPARPPAGTSGATATTRADRGRCLHRSSSTAFSSPALHIDARAAAHPQRPDWQACADSVGARFELAWWPGARAANA